MSPGGQHIELGIAENNLFLLLASLGLSGPLFGARLLPIGTLYDPFIQRGLDALSYACYQDARFLLVATPSGLTLAPEGGQHQSIVTPLIGIGSRLYSPTSPPMSTSLQPFWPLHSGICKNRTARRSICACRRVPSNSPNAR
jgi:pyruvate dehydrogenase E1 component